MTIHVDKDDDVVIGVSETLVETLICSFWMVDAIDNELDSVLEVEDEATAALVVPVGKRFQTLLRECCF